MAINKLSELESARDSLVLAVARIRDQASDLHDRDRLAYLLDEMLDIYMSLKGNIEHG